MLLSICLEISGLIYVQAEFGIKLACKGWYAIKPTKPNLAQSSGAAEYTDCISAEV